MNIGWKVEYSTIQTRAQVRVRVRMKVHIWVPCSLSLYSIFIVSLNVDCLLEILHGFNCWN